MDDGWTVVLIGAVRGPPIAANMDLRGATTVHQAAAIIGSVNLFIGLDSFPLHLAQAMRTPTVGIFGITSPEYILTMPGARAAVGGGETQGLRHRQLNSREVDDAGASISGVKPEMVLHEAYEAVTV